MASILLPKDSFHGTVTIERSPLWLPPRVAFEVDAIPRYRHTLPQTLQREATSEIVVELGAYGPFGERRFDPLQSFEVWRKQATALGFMLLSADHQLSKQQRCSYEIETFLFDKAQQSQTRNQRQFAREDELSVLFGSRSELRTELVAVGVPAEAVRSSSHFLEYGRERAQRDGCDRPSAPDLIAYGFLTIAEASPFSSPLAGSAAESIVRRALFDDWRVTDGVSAEIVAEVEGRFAETLWKRSDRDLKQLENWLLGAKSNFFGSLRRRRGAFALSEDQLRAGWAAAYWKSYRYVVSCLDCWATHFKAALPTPLTAFELTCFDARYLSRSALGGLPLILLDQIPLLQPIRSDLLEHPNDPRLQGVAQRLLWLYGRLCEERRSIDRDNKRREQPRSVKRQAAMAVDEALTRERLRVGDFSAVEDSFADSPTLTENETQDTLRAALNRAGIRCPAGGCRLEAEWDGPEDHRWVEVTYRCPEHDWRGSQRWTREELRALLVVEE